MPISKTMLQMRAEVDSQLSHTSKIVLSTKLDNGLNSTIYANIFTLDVGVLNAPHGDYTDVDITSYNLYKISCLRSRVIIKQP